MEKSLEVAQISVLAGSRVEHFMHGDGEVVVLSFSEELVLIEVELIGKPVAFGPGQDSDCVFVFVFCFFLLRFFDVLFIEGKVLVVHAVAFLVLAVRKRAVLGEA